MEPLHERRRRITLMFGDEPTNVDALQAILDSLDASVWAVRPDGEVCYGNRRWWEYSGLSPSERTVAACLQVIHPEERRELEARWESAQRRGDPCDMKCRLRRHADGSYRWHLCRALPVRAASGKWSGWILVATDIQDLLTVTSSPGAQPDVDVNVRRVRAVLQDAPLPVALFEGPHQRCVFANRAADDIAGCAQAGKTLREIFPDADHSVHALFDSVYESGQPASSQELSIWLDEGTGRREERFFDFVLQPTRDATGNVFGIVSACVDVTAAVQSRRILEQTADRLVRLQTLATALADVLDPETAGTIVVEQAKAALRAASCSVTLLDESGRSIEVLAGTPANLPSRMRRMSIDAPYPQAQVVRTGEPVILETREKIARAFPELAGWLESTGRQASVTLPLEAQGRTIGTLGLTFDHPKRFDASERAFLETLARQCGQAIERARLYRTAEKARAETEVQRARLRRLLMEAPVPIVVFRGRDHVLDLVNPRWEALIHGGRAPLGKPAREALAALAEQGVFELMDAAHRTGEPLVVTELPTRRAGRSEGPDFYFNLTIQPIREPDGHVSGLMVVGVEVTDQVRARRRLEEEMAAHEASEDERAQLLSAEQATRARAELANQSKDEFLAMLGHELRNPLAPIVVALRLIKMRGKHRSDRELTIIERQVEHLTRLVDDLLDVSRITRGMIQLRRDPLEVAPVVAKAVEMASPLLEQRQHHLVVEVPEEGLVVNADPVRLAQVVANLLTNAAKYTDRGGHIRIRAAAEDGHLVIRVEDDGIGMAPALVKTVFDRFVQGKRDIDRSQGGLGLGLTLVRSLVDLHGGTVSASSEGLGKGSEFVVRIPLLEGTRATPAKEQVTAPPAKNGAHQRVLLVDDNNDVAEVMEELLQAADYDVAVAHDGAEALRLAEQFRPHIAVLDIGLPVMDGYELARRLHNTTDGNKIRLVAVTGYGQPGDRERSQAAGFEEHLVKPVDVEVLLAAVAGKAH
jgi:PAS domain S-box-containing protein